MGEYEEVLERLREEGLNDEVSVLEKFSKNQLREKAAKADELERELNEAKARIADIEAAPKRIEALKKAGVDIDRLRPADRMVISQIKVEDLTEEKVAKYVEDLQLPVVEAGGGAGGEQEPPPSAARVAAVARSGGGAAGGTPVVITPADPHAFAGWSNERLRAFEEMYPAEWEALRQGYEISVPVLPPELNPLPASYVDRWKELHRTGVPGL